MNVLNIHKRTIHQPKSKIVELLKTLATKNDKVWPMEKWPRMRFDNGIKVGESGGHGPIRYMVEKYDPNTIIQWRFTKPTGFNGIHKFELEELEEDKTKLIHTIEMSTTFTGTLKWIGGIRALHNALIEDALDKIENHLSDTQKSTDWNFWVRFLRRILT